MYYRLIAPDWLKLDKVIEGDLLYQDMLKFNELGYNVYYLPNSPTTYTIPVDGSMIDKFEWCFVDMDLKEGVYESKEIFLDAIDAVGIKPTHVTDSGHGIHVYWRIINLDALSYLRFQRRLIRLLHTDEAVSKIFQLMRVAETTNTKIKDLPKQCKYLRASSKEYTAEEFDKLLPPIELEDEKYCQQHYNKTYGLNQDSLDIPDEPTLKWGKLLKDNAEVKRLWTEPTDDRSKNDFRLGHIMFANGFTKEEAASVLVNSAKAIQRAPIHRNNYAQGIVDKIWVFEATDSASPTVRDILTKGEDVLKGTRFPCNKLIDDTVHGYRLGQVMGIIGGSGVGKTTLTLNTFLWFAEHNPDYHHFFFSLEQPSGEIASRIKLICQGNENLYDKIHIVSNYTDTGEFRHFSIDSVEEHVLNFQKETGKKVGAVVVDHIGVLNKSDKNGESEGLIGICRRMKAVAVHCNIFLIMLSQAPREKAGIGDLELNKDAAFGTVFFESFLDWCVCMWQPLKRVYNLGAPTIMAFKFGKIRHKKQGEDKIQEDIRYQLYFEPKTERLREITQVEEQNLSYWQGQAVNARKLDRKTDIIPYESRRVDERQKKD